MTQPVAEVAPEVAPPVGLKQKIYNCTLRFKGEMLHSVPLERVTRDELKLLAFMHGPESIPPAEIVPLGTEVVLDHEDEHGEKHYVQSQVGEYLRLARKYDSRVNSGRGRINVEKCFNTTLVDFGAVIEAVDPIAAIDRAADAADAKAALAEAGVQRAQTMKQPEDAPPPRSTPGARLFGGNASPPAS